MANHAEPIEIHNARALAALNREIRRLLDSGRFTVSGILSHIRALDAPTTKAGIKGLRQDLREELEGLLRDGRCTIDQIVAHLRALGAEVSRSSIGREKQKWDERLARYREAQEVAIMFKRSLAETPDSDLGRTTMEMLKTLAFQQAGQMGGEDIDSKALATAARTLRDLEHAQKMSVERDLRIRAEVAKEAAEAAAEIAREEGLSAETVETIRARVLGIKR